MQRNTSDSYPVENDPMQVAAVKEGVYDAFTDEFNRCSWTVMEAIKKGVEASMPSEQEVIPWTLLPSGSYLGLDGKGTEGVGLLAFREGIRYLRHRCQVMTVRGQCLTLAEDQEIVVPR